MKKTKIEITHQLEKAKHHFMVVNPDKLTRLEVDMIKNEMVLRWCLSMGGCINEKEFKQKLNLLFLILHTF